MAINIKNIYNILWSVNGIAIKYNKRVIYPEIYLTDNKTHIAVTVCIALAYIA